MIIIKPSYEPVHLICYRHPPDLHQVMQRVALFSCCRFGGNSYVSSCTWLEPGNICRLWQDIEFLRENRGSRGRKLVILDCPCWKMPAEWFGEISYSQRRGGGRPWKPEALLHFNWVKFIMYKACKYKGGTYKYCTKICCTYIVFKKLVEAFGWSLVSNFGM